MQHNFRNLRSKQLDQCLDTFRATTTVPRPSRGWLRAIREAVGVSSGELAARMGTSRQLSMQQEKAEADERITLKSLRRMADALDCDLVYGLVPRAQSLRALVENRARAEATSNVLAVEHTMRLEDQGSEDISDVIEMETRRILQMRAGG